MDETQIVTEFINLFHNLDGHTVDAKRRSLFLLLHQHAAVPATIVDTLLARLVPRTHLEKLFYVEMLIYFRRTKELVEELRTGNNEIAISKLAKQMWFFRDLFTSPSPLTEDTFVTVILPCMSLSMRMKILNRIAVANNVQQQQRMDRLFDALHRFYGQVEAMAIIAVCSVTKIEYVIRNYFTKIALSKLRLIFDRDSCLIDIYIEEYKRYYENVRGLEYLLKYIAQKNLKRFHDLTVKYGINYVKLGCRLTKKFVKMRRSTDTIFNNEAFMTSNVLESLHCPSVVRTLGTKDFQIIYRQLFPKQFDSYKYENALSLWYYLPKNCRFQLFDNTFHKLITSNTKEYHYLITDSVLSCIDDSTVRENWVKIKLDGLRTTSIEPIKYLSTKQCFATIKEKMNLTNDITTRTKLIRILTENSLINNDLKALADVGRFVCTRCRNDNVNIRSQYLRSLLNRNELNRLGADHWISINKLLNIYKVKEEHFYGEEEFQIKYIEYLYNQGQTIDDEVIKYLQGGTNIGCRLETLSAQFRKVFIRHCIKLVPQCFVNNEKTIEDYDLHCLREVLEWNLIDSNCSMIDLRKSYPRLINMFKTVIEKVGKSGENQLFHSLNLNKYLITVCMFNNTLTEYDEEFSNLYWTEFHNLATEEHIFWFLKYKPTLIVDHFNNQIADVLLDKYCSKKLCLFIKKYTHLKLDEKLIQFCREKLTLNRNDQLTTNQLFEMLSILMAPFDYLQLVDSYKPVSDKVDLDDKTVADKYKQQISVLNSLKNINSFASLSFLFNFCVGDYFQNSLKSLYALVVRTLPGNKVKDIITRQFLTSLNLSKQKQGIYLICLTANQSEVLEMFNNVLTSHHNHPTSLKKHLFAASSKYYLRNRYSPEIWNIVKSTMVLLEKNDSESFKFLVENGDWHRSTTNEWELVYKTLTLILGVKDSIEYTRQLTDRVGINIVRELSVDFICDFIVSCDFFTQHAFTRHNSSCCGRCSLFCKFVLHSSDARKYDVFKRVLTQLKTFDDSTAMCKKHELASFTNTFYFAAISVESKFHVNDRLVEQIAVIWDELFVPVEAFEQYLMIRLIEIKYLNDDDKAIDKIVELLEHIASTFGVTVITKFCNLVVRSLDYFGFKELDFSYAILCSKVSKNTCLFVIQLLYELTEHGNYKEVILMLRQFDDVQVQMHLNMYFLDC